VEEAGCPSTPGRRAASAYWSYIGRGIRRRQATLPGVPSVRLIESSSVSAYGDKNASPNGYRSTVVGGSRLPSATVCCRVMTEAYDTGMDLLTESANELDMTAGACESSEDAARLFALADRIRSYLATSRPTTTLGMPRIVSDEVRLTDENVIHRTAGFNQSHIRILSE
jgi:hypothetical protein